MRKRRLIRQTASVFAICGVSVKEVVLGLGDAIVLVTDDGHQELHNLLVRACTRAYSVDVKLLYMHSPIAIPQAITSHSFERQGLPEPSLGLCVFIRGRGGSRFQT